MLHLSSTLFATIVAHAYYLRCAAYHHMFLALTVTSLLFHTTNGDHIRVVDKALAHACFVLVVFDTGRAIDSGQGWLLLFPLAAMGLWFAQGLYPSGDTEHRNRLHLLLHVVSVVGLHVYLQALHSAEAHAEEGHGARIIRMMIPGADVRG